MAANLWLFPGHAAQMQADCMRGPYTLETSPPSSSIGPPDCIAVTISHPTQRPRDRALGVARWLVTIAFVALSLIFLNSALGSAWIAAGPPTQFKAAWEHRALEHLLRSVAFALFALAAFRGLAAPPGVRPIVLLAVIAALALLCVAPAREFMLVDACLDRGGRWAQMSFVCER